MSIIYDNRGSGHNLSKGAFDSVSIAKPKFASLILHDYIDKPFGETYSHLMSDFNFDLTQSESKVGEALWTTYVKPHIKTLGGWAWDMAKGAITKGLASVAGLEPTTAAMIAAAELILSQVLTGTLDDLKNNPLSQTKTITLRTGQWVFIENDTSLRRRLGGVKHIEIEKKEDVKSVVSLGFFIEQAFDVNHAAVFNLERPHGQARQDVSIKQIREVPLEIANRLDNDETLSAVRELYFYKTFAYLYVEAPQTGTGGGRERRV